jgi:hypothetical protein
MRRPPIEEVGAELRDMMPGSNSGRWSIGAGTDMYSPSAVSFNCRG